MEKVEQDLFESLSLDDSVSCDGYQFKKRKSGRVTDEVDCRESAQVFADKTCCGHVAAFCLKCLSGYLLKMAEKRAQPHGVGCVWCQAKDVPPPFLINIRPVRT